jgi:hypothetical protein
MTLLFALLGPLAFVLLWLFVTGLAAALGGWGRFAERCAAPDGYEPEQRLRFQTVLLRRFRWFPARYRGCMNVGTGAAGLHLAPLAIFRFRHPPLLIPWNAVVSCEDGSALGFRWMDVTVRDVEPTLRFYGRVGDAVEEAWRRSSPADDRR